MIQDSLFHEDIYDAIKTCIQALGGNKFVGSQLWTEKPVDKAGEQLSDCLNRQRPQKLDPEQVLWILTESRKIGCHAGMFFISDASDYERPMPIEPESENAKLQREFIQMGQDMKNMMSRMEHLNNLGAK